MYNFVKLLAIVLYILYHCNEFKTHIHTMKHKNTSTQSNELLSYFNNKNKTCFAYKDALKIFPSAKENTVSKLLSDMTKRGLIMRIKEGIYYIIPFDKSILRFVASVLSLIM